MVIEHYKDNDPKPVYSRFSQRGRMMPDGLNYVNSWVEIGKGRCFQVMETEDPSLVQEWMNNWNDLVDFEVIPVLTSAETSRLFEKNEDEMPF
jgi:hypothetical protein